MKHIIIITLLLSLFACENETDRARKAWVGREIQIPETLTAKVYNRDTVCNDLLHKKYKILTYVDSTDCAECKLQLYYWHKLIQDVRPLSDSLAVVLIIHAQNPKAIQILSWQNRFDYPIFYDKGGRMGKMNHFPGKIDLQTYLLDENNKVLIAGSPLHDDALMLKYLRAIGVSGNSR